MRVSHCAPLMGIFLAGCSGLSTDPDLSIAQGTYALEAVDGVSLPIAVESGDCPREIFQGNLSLSPGAVDRRPLYDVLISLRLRCDPDRLLFIDQRRYVEDFGEWTIANGNVEFRSSKGFGRFRVALEPTVSTPTLKLPLDGRVYMFRRNNP